MIAVPFRRMTQAELDAFLEKAADILRGNVEHSEFRGYVFALLFFKRISDIFEEAIRHLAKKIGDELANDAAMQKKSLPFVVPADNGDRGRIDLTEVRHLEMRGNEAETKRIAPGDILVIEGHANSSEIGRAALGTECEEGMSFQNRLFRIRVADTEQIRPGFLVRALNTARIRRHWVATANTSSGLNTINRTALRRLILPVPKPTEQDAIIERLEAAEAAVTALTNQLTAA